MASVCEILACLERIAPKRFTFPGDKVGLQVGDPSAAVSRAAVAMDRSLGAIAFARENGCQLLLTHHPLIYNPIARVDPRDHVGRSVLELTGNGIAFIAAHTNWDSAVGGVNDTLAGIFALSEVRAFGSAAEVEVLKLVVYCPPESVQKVIDAASGAGAGRIGAYERCAFTSSGTGTFHGGPTTRPTVGRAGVTEEVAEIRVEMTLQAILREAVESAVREVHPYEEPALDFITLVPVAEQPAGRIGKLAAPTTLRQLAALADEKLVTRSWAWGDPDKGIETVAIVGGAADEEWTAAKAAGADVLLTGEVKQHVALEAVESGMAMIASGHYATEHPGCVTLRDRMAEAIPHVEWLLYAPPAGSHGRPL